MRKYYGITAPVWIFLLTLLLVILTGGIVGSSPCERTVRTCETTAVKAHTNNLTLQQAYISRCSEAACKSDKSGAALPFSILVLGVVLYIVWLRQGEPQGSGSAPARRSAPSSPPGSPTSSTPGKQPPAVPPAAKKPASPAAAKPKPAPAAAPPGEEDSLSAAEKTLYMSALEATDEQSKDELAQGLSKLTGDSDVESWKSAPSQDLVILTHALATAAILGGKDSKYRSGNGTGSAANLETMTKKALHQQCIDTLRSDLAGLVGGDYPKGLSEKSVEATLNALNADGALGGLSRLSKGTLVTLAGFLADA